MSPSLAVIILLIGHLFSSSASFLETMKLDSEEVSPTRTQTAPPIGSPVTSLDSRYPDGYLVTAFYSDLLCEIPTTVVYTLLKDCRRTSFYTYEYVLVTSSLLLISGQFFNPKCVSTDGTNPFINGLITNGSCRLRFNSYVISTPPLATEDAMPFIR